MPSVTPALRTRPRQSIYCHRVTSWRTRWRAPSGAPAASSERAAQPGARVGPPRRAAPAGALALAPALRGRADRAPEALDVAQRLGERGVRALARRGHQQRADRDRALRGVQRRPARLHEQVVQLLQQRAPLLVQLVQVVRAADRRRRLRSNRVRKYPTPQR